LVRIANFQFNIHLTLRQTALSRPFSSDITKMNGNRRCSRGSIIAICCGILVVIVLAIGIGLGLRTKTNSTGGILSPGNSTGGSFKLCRARSMGDIVVAQTLLSVLPLTQARCSRQAVPDLPDP